jgi:predicted transglutaminase-like cysteine proteinase
MPLVDDDWAKRVSSDVFASYVEPLLETGSLSSEEVLWIKFTRRRIRNREMAARNRLNKRMRDQQIADEVTSLYNIIADLNRQIENLRDMHRVQLFSVEQ